MLFDLGRKVFIQAGEAQEELDAAATLEGEYELPADELTIATIEALDSGTLVSEERAALAKAAIDLAEELLDAERFEPAGKLAVLAVQSANHQKDAELKKEVLQRKNQLVRLVDAWEEVQASLKTLADRPQ